MKLLFNPLNLHSLTHDVPLGIYENVCAICGQSALEDFAAGQTFPWYPQVHKEP